MTTKNLISPIRYAALFCLFVGAIAAIIDLDFALLGGVAVLVLGATEIALVPSSHDIPSRATEFRPNAFWVATRLDVVYGLLENSIYQPATNELENERLSLIAQLIALDPNGEYMGQGVTWNNYE